MAALVDNTWACCIGAFETVVVDDVDDVVVVVVVVVVLVVVAASFVAVVDKALVVWGASCCCWWLLSNFVFPPAACSVSEGSLPMVGLVVLVVAWLTVALPSSFQLRRTPYKGNDSGNLSAVWCHSAKLCIPKKTSLHYQPAAFQCF